MLHVARWIVIAGIIAAGFAALFISGIGQFAFQGERAYFCGTILAFFALGMLAILFQRWRDALWIETTILILGLLGSIVGLNMVFHEAEVSLAGAHDPSVIWPMMGKLFGGLFLSFTATGAGIGSMLAIRVSRRLLGNADE